MSRYTFYDEVEKRHYVEEFPFELQVKEVGKCYHNFSPATDKLGELEDFMERNGFETVKDLEKNYETKRYLNMHETFENLLKAHQVQHENDVKGLEEIKKSCIKEVRKLLKELISDMKGLYKTSVNGTTYVCLKSVVNRLKYAKFDIEERL